MNFISKFLGLFIFLLFHKTLCAQDAFSLLVGKYKMSSTADDARMLEIGEDSVMTSYSLYNGPNLSFKILEVGGDKLTVTSMPKQTNSQVPDTGIYQSEESGIAIQKNNSKPKVSQWNYTLNDSLLIIQDNITGMKEVAVSCKTGTCDLQKDYLRLSMIDVDLPYDNAHQYEAFQMLEGARIFYYGPYKSSFNAIYGSGSAICVNDRFVNPILLTTEVRDIPVPILASKLNVIGFIDRNTEMNDLKTLLGYLAQDGIHEIYLAVRENAEVSQPLQIRLARLENKSLDIAKMKGNVEDWINAKN